MARDVCRTPHIGLASDQGHGDAAEVLLEGTGWPAMSGALTEVRKARFILVVGSDIAKLNPIVASEIHLAARGGARPGPPGPRSAQMARLSGDHLWTKPGSLRHALAAAAKVTVEKGWTDEAFVRERTEGFDGFARSLAGLDLGALAAASGLTVPVIEDLARGLAQAPTAMAFFTTGIAGLDRDTVALLHGLFLAAGEDRPGGLRREPRPRRSPTSSAATDVGASNRFLPGHRRAEGPSAGRTPRELLADLRLAAQGPGRGRPRRGDRPPRGPHQGTRLPPLYRRLHQSLRRPGPRRPARRPPTPRPTGPIPTPSAASSSTARRSSRLPGVRPAWRVYADLGRPARRRLALRPRPEAVLAEIAAGRARLRRRHLRQAREGPRPAVAVRRRAPGRHLVRLRRRGRGRKLRFAAVPAADFPAPGAVGRVPLPAHGRQGQLLLAPQQRHEEDPDPQPGIQRPAPPVSPRLRRGRRRPTPRALGAPGPAPVERRRRRRLDAGRRPDLRRTSGPGPSTSPTSSRTWSPASSTPPGRPSTRTRIRPSPCGSRRCDHVHPAQETRSRRSSPRLAADYELYGPVVRADGGDPMFERVDDPAAVRLDARHHLQPAEVRRLSPGRTDHVLPLRPGDPPRPRSTATTSSGPRPWSASGPATSTGLLCLDRFFLGQEFVDEVYRDHRKKMFIVANTCVRPFPQCFCVCTDSGPAAREGYDVAPDRPSATATCSRVGSEKGEALARRARPGRRPAPTRRPSRRPSSTPRSPYSTPRPTENKAWISRVMNRITMGFITNDVWEYIGDQCFECGACSFVCPTCSCFNIEDMAAARRAGPTGLRSWDSCSFEGYTRMAGDHNPRKPVEDRRNKRFFCKLSYSQSKKYLRPGCVGCGRCVRVCPGDIGMPNVVTYIRREITKAGDDMSASEPPASIVTVPEIAVIDEVRDEIEDVQHLLLLASRPGRSGPGFRIKSGPVRHVHGLRGRRVRRVPAAQPRGRPAPPHRSARWARSPAALHAAQGRATRSASAAPSATASPSRTIKGKNVIYVAGGIGLIPLRSSIVHVLQHRQDFGRIILIYGARSPQGPDVPARHRRSGRRPRASRPTSPSTGPSRAGRARSGFVHTLVEPGQGPGREHRRLRLRPAGHVQLRHQGAAGRRAQGRRHHLDARAAHEVRHRQVPALRHRPDARLHRRPGLHLPADQDPGGADLMDDLRTASSDVLRESRPASSAWGITCARDDGVGPAIVEARPRRPAAGPDWPGRRRGRPRELRPRRSPAATAQNVVFVDAVGRRRRARRPSSSAGWPISAEAGKLLDPQARPRAQRQVLEAAGKKAYLLGHRRPATSISARASTPDGRTEPPAIVRDAILGRLDPQPPGEPLMNADHSTDSFCRASAVLARRGGVVALVCRASGRSPASLNLVLRRGLGGPAL
ncbi:MAG: 4Fe-4S dicluster domain-containing protein [Marinilabiliales bacterium]|nr:4Fe-4S dicluster domain-containing protein [Marinilabiliales bacterium]